MKNAECFSDREGQPAPVAFHFNGGSCCLLDGHKL